MSLLNIEDSLVARVATRLARESRARRGDDAVARRPAEPRSSVPAEGDGAPQRSLAASSGRCAERLMREQPEILAFVLAGTAQLAPETRAVGVFLGDVVFETFRLVGRATRSLGAGSFVAALRGNREMALRVGQAHDRIAERYLRNSRTLRQPALIRYVTGVLLEPEPASPHAMPRDELGPLFIIIKSIIDVLDEDAEAAAKATSGVEIT